MDRLGGSNKVVLAVVAAVILVVFAFVPARVGAQTVSECQEAVEQMYELQYYGALTSALMIDAGGNAINELGKYDQCRELTNPKKYY